MEMIDWQILYGQFLKKLKKKWADPKMDQVPNCKLARQSVEEKLAYLKSAQGDHQKEMNIMYMIISELGSTVGQHDLDINEMGKRLPYKV